MSWVTSFMLWALEKCFKTQKSKAAYLVPFLSYSQESWIMSTTPGPGLSSLLVSLPLAPCNIFQSLEPCASISSHWQGTCSSLSWFRQIQGCPLPCTSSLVSSPSWNSGMSAPQCPPCYILCSMGIHPSHQLHAFSSCISSTPLA